MSARLARTIGNKNVSINASGRPYSLLSGRRIRRTAMKPSTVTATGAVSPNSASNAIKGGQGNAVTAIKRNRTAPAQHAATSAGGESRGDPGDIDHHCRHCLHNLRGEGNDQS